MIGALKIKEMCYLHAEGFSGGALKHGPFALIEGECNTQYTAVFFYSIFPLCSLTVPPYLIITPPPCFPITTRTPGTEGSNGQTPVIAIILDDHHAMHMRIAAEEVSGCAALHTSLSL